MRIAIFHFHLRPGGVTRVIEMACDALEKMGHDPFVLTGEPASPSCRISSDRIAVVPALAYDAGVERTDELVRDAENALQKRWGGLADVLHIHNHSLGKCLALPGAVLRWAGQGYAMVLQIHDFAENGRPENYRKLRAAGLPPILYPVASRIRFAFLNSRDAGVFERLGAGESHLLPNPVELPEGGIAVEPNSLHADRLIVYPTRGIRRKNLGEAVLWASLIEPGAVICISSVPQSPRDLAAYGVWKRFAEDLNLPILFDVMGELRRPLADLILGADLCLTTSVAEGFGMAFLEPWLAGKSLAGRNLLEVTRDFSQQGVHLNTLYDFLRIPEETLASDSLEHLVARCVAEMSAAYDVEFADDQVSSALGAIRTGGGVDFGRLDEPLQRDVISHVVARRIPRTEIIPSFLVNDLSCVTSNRERIREKYHPRAYAEQLDALYREVGEATAGPTQFLDPRKVLHEFLDYRNFFALKA